MKPQFIFTSILIAMLIFGFAADTFAQATSSITGTVSDKKTGETIIGAGVKIPNTNRAVPTNVDGKYTLGGLTPGIYTLEVSYMGYLTKRIVEIDVKANTVTTVNVILEESEAEKLEAVVITATARQESSSALYALQKNNTAISDGISAELIRKSPDRTTSDVLKRVSGTTIQDNKFVVVRGLSDRYNTALLDGAPLPSTEPNRKAFSFDIVPSNLVDNIVISKTATPDLPADFAGGAVQISTKDIPDHNFISVGVGYGYNTVSTFRNFKSGYRTASDYLGFDGGSRQLADNFPSTSKILNMGTGPQSIPLLKTMNNSFKVYDNNAFLSQNYQFTIGRVKTMRESGNHFATTISLTYRNAETTNPNVTRRYNGYDFRDSQYKFSSNIGGLANFAYAFGKNKITFKNIYNRIFDDLFTYRTGSNASNSSYDSRFYAFDLTQKSLLKSTLEGEHQLGGKLSKIKWNIGLSNIINDQPDQRKVNYLQNSAGDPFVASVTTLGKENTRFFSRLNENIYSGSINYSMPLSLFNRTNLLKFGLFSQYRDRAFDARFIGLVINTNKDGFNEIRTRPVENLFSPNVINEGYFDLQEIPNFNDRYTANSLTNSAFFMMDTKFTDRLRAVYGLRVEKFDLSLRTKNPTQTKAQAELNNVDILPSVNLSYALTDKANLRAAYYKTLARPEFRELAPFAYYDYENFASVLGNSNLKRALIDNADIRYEFYPNRGQVFSASIFYKKFLNAIEPSIEDQNSTPAISYFNSSTAYVYGFELEVRKTLDFISTAPLFKNTTAYINLSATKSEILNLNPNALIKKRPLVGQSPYVINAGLQHTALDNKFSLNLLYNRVGRRINLVGGTRFPDVYESPRDILDFQIGYKVMRSRAEIKLNMSDLLNQSNLFYFDYDQGKSYNVATDEILRKYKQGTTFSLSFNYTIR